MFLGSISAAAATDAAARNPGRPPSAGLYLEAGPAFPGYIDVRIPGDEGTRFSFVDDLETDPVLTWRVEAWWRPGGRHRLRALAAPLRSTAEGRLDRDIVFEGETFPAGHALEGTYRFDSYRLTWSYDVYRGERLQAALGLTAKIRDAEVSLEGAGLEETKVNTGFVPLVHLDGRLAVSPSTALVLVADALAAPQGRAEDVLFAFEWQATRSAALRAGYRILEGGADNDEVYNFTLYHYSVAGLVVRL